MNELLDLIKDLKPILEFLSKLLDILLKAVQFRKTVEKPKQENSKKPSETLKKS